VAAARPSSAGLARGHGWFGNGTFGDLAANDLAGLQKAAAEVEHPDRLGRLEVRFMQLDRGGEAATGRVVRLPR